MDPGLTGPDPVWECFRKGHGHVYYALIVLMGLGLSMDNWQGAVIAMLACGVFVDCWGHGYCH